MTALLADTEASLALFMEGMTGRYVHVKPVSGFMGRLARSDPHEAGRSVDTIYLPESIDSGLGSDISRGVYRLVAMQQLGYRDYGTYAFRREAALAMLPGLQNGPADPTARNRDSDLTWLFRQFPRPALARGLFELIELARVTARLIDSYPGLRKYLQGWQPEAGALVAFADLLFQPLAPSGTAALPEIAALHAPDATVYRSADLLIRWYPQADELVFELPDDVPQIIEWLQREDRLDDWRDDLARMDASAAIAADAENMIAELGEDAAGNVRPPQSNTTIRTEDRDTLSRRIDMERASIRDALGADRSRSRSYRYDEWDCNQQRYRRAWCTLFEQPCEAESDPTEMERAVRPLVRRVQRQFEHIRPAGMSRQRRIVDGDEIDWNALVDSRVDVRAGRSPDDRVYSRRERLRRDVTTAFLVDLSASTDDPVNKPEPVAVAAGEPGNLRDPFDDDPWETAPPEPDDRRRIIDVLTESVALMSVALTRLGDAYGVYGFSGYGRHEVEFYTAKEPHQALDGRVMSAIAGMSPKRSTRMGPAIRHATAKLQAAGGGQRILLIISDGFPQDCDYGPDRGQHDYGVADTARALEEAERAGVDTFCVTVDTSAHDYLRRMCPNNRYLVIEQLEQLPDALTKIYQALTR